MTTQTAEISTDQVITIAFGPYIHKYGVQQIRTAISRIPEFIWIITNNTVSLIFRGQEIGQIEFAEKPLVCITIAPYQELTQLLREELPD